MNPISALLFLLVNLLLVSESFEFQCPKGCSADGSLSVKHSGKWTDHSANIRTSDYHTGKKTHQKKTKKITKKTSTVKKDKSAKKIKSSLVVKGTANKKPQHREGGSWYFVQSGDTIPSDYSTSTNGKWVFHQQNDNVNSGMTHFRQFMTKNRGTIKNYCDSGDFNGLAGYLEQHKSESGTDGVNWSKLISSGDAYGRSGADSDIGRYFQSFVILGDDSNSFNIDDFDFSRIFSTSGEADGVFSDGYGGGWLQELVGGYGGDGGMSFFDLFDDDEDDYAEYNLGGLGGYDLIEGGGGVGTYKHYDDRGVGYGVGVSGGGGGGESSYSSWSTSSQPVVSSYGSSAYAV